MIIVLAPFHPLQLAQSEALCRLAQQYQSLVIGVIAHADDTISVQRRQEWIRDVLPETEISVFDFEEIRNNAGNRLAIYSEIYLADHGRHMTELEEALPPHKVNHLLTENELTEAQVLSNPHKYWQALPTQVRPLFVKRVVLFGPESTGKSTLAKALAQELRTVWVPEFVRNFLDLKKAFYDAGGPSSAEICEPGDVPTIVLGQAATEDALAEQAHKVLVCDTNCLETLVYTKHYFGLEEKWLQDFIAARPYHLYLLTHIDIPWVPDPPHRAVPGSRDEIFTLFKNELDSRNLPYVNITGSFEQRKKAALEAVAHLMKN